MSIKLITSSLLASFLLLGCSGSSDSTDPVVTSIDGQLIDSYVENADYICGGETLVRQTDKDGRFSCNAYPISFKLGGLKLGQISTLQLDKQVFPQDLLSVTRTDINNTAVVAMARLLQSCDENNNSADGLKISQLIKESLTTEEDFNADAIDSYTEITVDEATAVEHLTQTTAFIDAVNAASIPATIKTALLSSSATLTQEVKDTLAYMGNEERLAYDVYNKLYETSPLMQLTNIATNSESKHIQTVQLLVQKYITDPSEFSNIDLPELSYKNTAIADMQAGVYDIEAIQNLYDALIEKGQASDQDALEVGCMVEVTDITDLLQDIETARNAYAPDVVTAFEFLRDGSYSHYWAFDKGLVNMGVTEGCCVLGSEYCHPEYPQSTGGSADTSGTGPHDGTGNKYGQQ